MSDTPRTDAETYKDRYGDRETPEDVVPAQLCQELERENAQLRKEREEIKQELFGLRGMVTSKTLSSGSISMLQHAQKAIDAILAKLEGGR